jgi:hypothetical protein
MSSATSIKHAREKLGTVPAAAGAQEAQRAGNRDGFRTSHFFILMSLVAATAAVVMARQPAPEHLVLLSLMIGAAGVCGATLYAALAPLVRKDAVAVRAPLSERARAALEREKMLVLRSIKELEFDRAMGKMSAADFDELAGRLRIRALALMKQLDTPEPAYRARIEQDLAARLEEASTAVQACACGTANDPDAAFCKRCGTRLMAG